MQASVARRSRFLIIAVVALVCLSFAAWYFGGMLFAPPTPAHRNSNSTGSGQSNTSASRFPPETHIAVPRVGKTDSGKRPTFESGVVLPEWQPDGYSINSYQTGLQQISSQTGAKWIEMPVIFFQATNSSTQITTTYSTVTVDSVAQGIRIARALGYHVFLNPLLTVEHGIGNDHWSGRINFATYQQEQQWFTNYWQAFRPYVEAAAQNGADQLAIGTEYQWLQQNAPASLWNQLIANIHSVFPGTLTYDINWSQQAPQIPAWMKNPLLSMIGVSEYIPLVGYPTRVEPSAMPALWATYAKPFLDTVSKAAGKPVFISEIGYRNSSDALYEPFLQQTNAPADPAEQAGAYNAALTNVATDAAINGIYFWGWENVQALQTSQQAAAVLHQWYTSPQL
jgi:hypothetical protein